MGHFKSPLCVALDTPDFARALDLVRAVKPHAGLVKVGMEFFYAHGASGYEAVAGEGLPVFLDLKLHDIPNTVASALKSLFDLKPAPAIIDVHAAGGEAMLKAAVDAAAGRSRLIAVTVLTSLSDRDIVAAGFDSSRSGSDIAVSLAELAKRSGLDGVVCSPQEVAAIKRACGKDFLTVVPGIRPAGAAEGDQRRTAIPAAARAAGADILVVGRPVTGAADPAHAAQQIVESLREPA
jgi:orotidine-5'-phosphate decarboxylase